MIKSEIRKLFKQKRKELSHSQIEKFDDLILIQFQQIALPYLSCVDSYIASEKHIEPDTSLILRYLQFRYPAIAIAAPKIEGEGFQLSHYLLSDTTDFVSNQFEINEPKSGRMIRETDIDLVLIPLLAFDKEGYRVGYGKGYYDRFLQKCRKDVLKVGISFFDPVEKIIDRHPEDVQMDYCCTPDQLYSWKKLS